MEIEHWKNEKFTLAEKIFRQINYSENSLVKTRFHRFHEFFVRRDFERFSLFPNSQWHCLTKKIFRQSNSLVISLVKTLLSPNFCQKYVRLNRSNFQTVKMYK